MGDGQGKNFARVHQRQQVTLTARLNETREIAAAISERFDVGASDNLTVMAAEAIKSLVFELITDSGRSGVDPKGAMQLAAALKNASQAQGVSNARREKVEAEFKAGVEKAVDQVVRVKGITAETADAIKSQILGVRK